MKKGIIILIILILGVVLIYKHHETHRKDAAGGYYAQLNHSYPYNQNEGMFNGSNLNLPPMDVTSINVNKDSNTLTIKTNMPYTGNEPLNYLQAIRFYFSEGQNSSLDSLNVQYISANGLLEAIVHGSQDFNVSNITEFESLAYVNQYNQTLTYSV